MIIMFGDEVLKQVNEIVNQDYKILVAFLTGNSVNKELRKLLGSAI